jgi:GTP cyclohydrolase I
VSSAPARLRVTHTLPAVDPQAAERAAAALLIALGMDLEDPVVADTPRRMAHALLEMTTPRDFELTTFPNEGAVGELVVVEDLPVRSLCEHHMLPFTGVAHVGYLPGDRILGLSKFARLVELHASRPQTQERLTRRIVDALEEGLAPYGVGVVVEAEHTCLSLRGARASGVRTHTTALSGRLRDDPQLRSEFLAVARRR